MQSYLLKATDEEMRDWKAAAEEAGLSFAEWLRRAAGQAATVRKSQGTQEQLLEALPGFTGEPDSIRFPSPATLDAVSKSVEVAPEASPAMPEGATAAATAERDSPPASAASKGGKLDPNCRNKDYHWKVEPGNVCSFCGGSR